MKKIEINLYEYRELSPEAKERALADFVENNDLDFLEGHLTYALKKELDERGIKYDHDSIEVYCSLSHSQGDGFMFEADMEWRGSMLRIKQSGHYYHEKSRTIDVIDGEELTEAQMGQFEAVYESVCKKIRDIGYAEIDRQNSPEFFAGMCDANEWTFEENGKMRNS